MSAAFRVHGLAAARRRYTSRPPAPVTVQRVHPLAWAEALRLADGDRSRLRIQNAETVLVVNRGRS